MITHRPELVRIEFFADDLKEISEITECSECIEALSTFECRPADQLIFIHRENSLVDRQSVSRITRANNKY